MSSGPSEVAAPPSTPPTASLATADTIVEQLVAIADSSTDMIAVTDETFRPTYINAAARSFFGLGHDTPAGTLDLYTGIDPELRDELRQQVRTSLVTTGRYQTRYVLTAPHTGDQRFVAASYSALRTWSGEALGFAVVCHDVDEPTSATGYVANEALIERAVMEDELTRAIELDQFELFFQPVIEVANGRTRGLEALLRWNHPTRGVLAPGVFLAAVESAGLTTALGHWTIQAAARAVADFERAGCPTSIGINLFSAQLVTPDLIERMQSAATAAGVDVARLAIEVSEETLMDDVRTAAPVFADLRSAGITVAVDDFGTGYSNLGRLRELDVDFIKIDRSLVVGIDQDARAQQLLSAVMGLAEALDANALAEGVETREELEVVAHLGCRFVQGFYTGRPRPLGEAAETADFQHAPT
ncbi:MAG: EAL domain-containing protein [Actinomycetota bacterium]